METLFESTTIASLAEEIDKTKNMLKQLQPPTDQASGEVEKIKL